MLYVYLVASAALIPILDIFFDILKESYSWWLVPVLFIGFFLGFIILHLAVFAVSALIVNPNTGTGVAILAVMIIIIIISISHLTVNKKHKYIKG